jgi:predicted enzyme related to lactoylglutathione lyase
LNGGMIPSQVMGPDVPPHWGVYFAVEDTDEAVERAQGIGAKVLAPPMDVPKGSFASLADPQGAAFSIVAGQFDP